MDINLGQRIKFVGFDWNGGGGGEISLIKRRGGLGQNIDANHAHLLEDTPTSLTYNPTARLQLRIRSENGVYPVLLSS